MKKVLSIILSVMLVASLNISAFAADVDARQPDVYVNGNKVEFQDQAPYITDEGRTLVPARGVFEAMGSVVEWDPENYVVTVSNENQKKEITLKIGDANMTVKTADEETTKVLDVPAQLMNNRTMIPLRAVSEALESVVVWNPGDYSVYISMSQKISIDQFPSFFPTGGSGNKDDKTETEEPVQEPEIKDEDKMIISLYTDAEDVKAGDEFEVFVKVENPAKDMTLVGLALSFIYEKEQFEYVEDSAKIYDAEGNTIATKMKSENTEFDKGAKVAYACKDGARFINEDAAIYSVKFKALTDEGGNISLSDGYVKGKGYDILIILNNGKDDKALMYEGKWLTIKTEPIEVK